MLHQGNVVLLGRIVQQRRRPRAVRTFEIFKNDDGDLRPLGRPQHRGIGAPRCHAAEQHRRNQGELPNQEYVSFQVFPHFAPK